MRKNQDNIDADKLKGVLITRTAIKTLVDEDVVERIISFEFKDVREMVHVHQEIELTGFGLFKVSGRKLKNKILKIQNSIAAWEKRKEEMTEDISAERKKHWDAYLQKNRELLEFLKQKEKEYEDKH